MSFSPDEYGQGWIEYLLILILLGIIVWILWRLFSPAIQLYLGQILTQITGK